MTFRGAAILAGSPLVWRALIVAVAGIGIAAELAAPAAPSGSAPLPPDPTVSGSPNGRAVRASVTDYPDIAEHPLFSPSRRPWSPPRKPLAEEATPAQKLAPPSGYTVAGVIIGDDIRRALLKPPGGGPIAIFREGQEVDGWTLRAIGPDKLHFEMDGSVYDLGFPAPRQGGR